MLDIQFHLYLAPISDLVFKEAFDKGDALKYQLLYEKYIKNGPVFSVLVIDSRGGLNKFLEKSHKTQHKLFLDLGTIPRQLILINQDNIDFYLQEYNYE